MEKGDASHSAYYVCTAILGGGRKERRDCYRHKNIKSNNFVYD